MQQDREAGREGEVMGKSESEGKKDGGGEGGVGEKRLHLERGRNGGEKRKEGRWMADEEKETNLYAVSVLILMY